MNWAQLVFLLVLGLVLAKAEDILNLGDALEKVSQTDNRLYMRFACHGKLNGLRLPIAGSCVDYYECKHGMTERKTCKEGFHFSNLALTCIEERLSKCKPEQSTESGAKCEGICCGRQDGLYPVKNSCSEYIVCVNGQIFQRKCGKGLEFSALNLICDMPDRAMCKVDDSIENADEDKLERAEEEEEEKEEEEDEEEEEEEEEEVDNEQQDYFNGPKPTMYMVSHRVCRLHPTGFTIGIPGSCNKFYLCIEGVGYLKSCGNMQFNIKQHYCDSKTRIYCPSIEQDDVILPDDEYLLIRPLPIPFEPEEIEEEQHLDSLVEEEEEIEPQPRPKPHKHRPAQKTDESENLKKPGKPEKQEKIEKLSKVEPEEIEEEQHLDSLVEEEEEIEPQPRPKPHKYRPAQKTDESANLKKPGKPEKQEKIEKLSKEEIKKQNLPFVEIRPTPPVIDDEDDEEQDVPARPNTKPKKPSPTPPIAPKVPPTRETFLEKEIEVAPASGNICANQPVGALIALPDDCNKYIRCRWDWYQRRAAEVMTCPRGMHFNASSKYCDRPENAGCEIKSEKTNERKSHRKFPKVL